MVLLETENKLESCCFKLSSRLLLSKKQFRFLQKLNNYDILHYKTALTGLLALLQHLQTLTLFPYYKVTLTLNNTHIVASKMYVHVYINDKNNQYH